MLQTTNYLADRSNIR